ncbi:MAG: hypothetical protein FJ276_07900 [Planctomycetes bacterium]|nr:hypothetical protein [Planctomycetota bacterium]
MSEYQYVGFRAVDAPLSDDQLQYMEERSSRAEVTRWSFDIEYHYGDFRGNPVEMLRRGYDVHLHYANFGIRKLMFRLPSGLPIPEALCSEYLLGDAVSWKADPEGPAGTLTISATGELPGLDDLFDLDEHLDGVVGVRQQLLDGDVRPLYAAWLCGCHCGDFDWESEVEPSVPAGLDTVSEPVSAMLEFFGVSPFVLAAAGDSSHPLPEQADRGVVMGRWLKSIRAETLRAWLLRFLVDEPALAKSECLQAFRESNRIPQWPVTKGTRTFAQLVSRAEEHADVERQREQQRGQEARRTRLAEMAESPQKYLEEVDRAVAMRGRDGYQKAANLLSELQEAIGGPKGEKLVRKHAAHLAKKHPTLRMLTGALRRKGLLS